MPLTDVAIRNAKPRPKSYKLSDGGGLYLQVEPSGGKLWRQKYRFEDREKKLAIGSYPAISLSEARKRRDQARAQLSAGLDPAREKQLAKYRAKAAACNTFGEVAKEFIAKREREGMSKSTVEKSGYYISRLGLGITRLPVADPPRKSLKRCVASRPRATMRRPAGCCNSPGASSATRWRRRGSRTIRLAICAAP